MVSSNNVIVETRGRTLEEMAHLFGIEDDSNEREGPSERQG